MKILTCSGQKLIVSQKSMVSLFIIPNIKCAQLINITKIHSYLFFVILQAIDSCPLSILQSLYIRRCPKIQTNPFEILKNVRYIHNQ